MQDYFETTYKFLELSPHVLIPMHGRINLWPKYMLCGYLRYGELIVSLYDFFKKKETLSLLPFSGSCSTGYTYMLQVLLFTFFFEFYVHIQFKCSLLASYPIWRDFHLKNNMPVSRLCTHSDPVCVYPGIEGLEKRPFCTL